ncbi:MAG: VCBS repeat-containing protein [Myxococcota bacterium]
MRHYLALSLIATVVPLFSGCGSGSSPAETGPSGDVAAANPDTEDASLGEGSLEDVAQGEDAGVEGDANLGPELGDEGSVTEDATIEGDAPVEGCPENWGGDDCGTCAAGWSGESCDVCPENWSGDGCDTCAGGWSGESCDVCPENWSGDGCDTCAGGWSGESCDVCPENWAGEACDACSEAFMGDDCGTCADPTFTGEGCDECADPRFTGAGCDECSDPTFTGEGCDECADPSFTGSACDECADPTFTGAACDECADPKFTGSMCDECADSNFSGDACDQFFRQLWPLSTARSTSNRPVFRVAMVPETLESARITLCEDVSCEAELLTFEIMGGSGPCPEPVPSGPIYWYAEGVVGGEVVTGMTPVWQLHIPAHPAPHATAWGSTFDLELDGYADVLVGSCGLSGCTELVGLHQGGSAGPSPLPVDIITDPQASSSFGFSVSTAGDVNGDGLPDLIVGAGLGDSAHLFLNSPEGILPEPVQSWQVPGAWFGFSVASAGDVNGDGYGDVIVGSMLGFSAFLYYGGPEGPGPGPNTSLSTGAFGFGVSVSSAGDVNGDGYEDLICGAANGIPPEASLWLGGPEGPSAVASQIITGDGTFAISTRGAGDLNGDGYADIVIGNPDGNLFVVHYGGPDGLDMEAPFTATGPTTNFGLSVAGAGDVNGDGFGDVVISAKDKAFVYHGSEGGLVEDPVITLQGPMASQFGDSVAAIGDTNNDGFDDLGVGAPSGTSAYAFFGGAGGLQGAWDVWMTASEQGDDEAPTAGYGFTVGHSVR